MNAFVTCFHHIAIRCRDLDRSVAFYRTLGFADNMAWGEGDGRAVMLSLNGVCIELFANGREDVPEGKWIHLALTAPDCDAAYQAALNAGATSHIEPKEVTIANYTKPFPVRLAFVKGLDGELLEFFQPR